MFELALAVFHARAEGVDRGRAKARHERTREDNVVGRKRDVQLGTGDTREDEEPQPLFIANPEIVWASEELNVYQEGCLSIPDYYGDVERPSRVRVRYLDRDGKVQEMNADGLLATCVQHEIDHLNGVLFIDHLSRLKRERVMKKYTKAARLRSEA